MTVWKRNKTWMFEFQYQGKRYTQGGFPTKMKARKAELSLRERLTRPLSDMDLLTLTVKRLEYLEKNRTPKYFEENKRRLKHFLEFFPKHSVSQITRDDIEKYLTTLKGDYNVNYQLRIIRALFNHGVEREWFKNNPTRGIKFKPTIKKRKYIPSKEDIHKILLLAEWQDMAFFLTLKNTLARVSEIYRLKWEDIDFENRKITLYTRKKRGGHFTPRIIPMNTELFHTLKTLDKTSSYVFTNPKTNQPFQDKKKVLIGLCRQAKIKRFTFHSFRHYGASTLASKGVPLQDIQYILGHESLHTTAIYIQSLIGSTTITMEKI